MTAPGKFLRASGIDKIGADLERLNFQAALPQRRHDAEADGGLADTAVSAGDDECRNSSHVVSLCNSPMRGGKDRRSSS